MDLYLLLITDDTITEKEKEVFSKCLNTNFLNLQKLKSCSFVHDNVPLTSCPTLFAASLNVSTLKQDQIIQNWQRVYDPCKQLHFFMNKGLKTQNSKHILLENPLQSANAIHHLADRLPSNGTFHLNVIVSHKFIACNNQSCNDSLIGALYRLCSWHWAQVSVVHTEDTLAESFHCYKDILNAKIISNQDEEEENPLLWRGVLDRCSPDHQFDPVHQKTESYELKFMLSKSLVNDAVSYSKKDYHSNSYKKDYAHQLSETMEVLDACDLTTIPLNLFASPMMKLFVNGDPDENSLINYLISRPGLALITRLQYNKGKSNSWPNLLVTEKWKKAVLSTNSEYPTIPLDRFPGHFTFAITAITNENGSSNISAFLLKSATVEGSIDDITDYLITEDTAKDFTFLENLDQLDTTEVIDDPSDWPERRHLLQMQIEADKHFRNTISEMSPSHFPLISAAEVGKFFTSSGESKEDIINLDIIKSKLGLCRELQNFENMNEAEWPEVLNVRFHDIYYSIDAEEELNYNQVKNKYILCETFSIYSEQQSAANHRTLSEYSSSSSLDASKGRNVKKNSNTSSTLTCLDTLKYNHHQDIIFSPFTPSVRESMLMEQNNSRCSPVRRVKKTLKRNRIRSEKTNNKAIEFTTDSFELNERHKMKLREAVVFALSKCNIDFHHELFKPCAKKLFAVCKPFVMDVVGKGETSARLKSIAESHVQQVVHFEKYRC